VNDVTHILSAIEQGDPQASQQLWKVVYEELRRLAGAQMAREMPGQTLDATALVHEAFLRLAGDQDQTFANRRHFFAAAAEAMRRILVETARRKGREKHGGGRKREHADLDTLDASAPAEELLALHEALEQFAAHDPVKAQLVELRFFGGLTLAEAAECLNISLSSADRAWRYARAWLYNAMSADGPEDRPNDPVQ
jgi:RNA polymerase sigma factor (TIGR02999 family)